MCLAVPMKILQISGGIGIADLSGVKREVNLNLIEDPKVGDYVIVHAGFAIQKLDEVEAEKTLELLREISAYEVP